MSTETNPTQAMQFDAFVQTVNIDHRSEFTHFSSGAIARVIYGGPRYTADVYEGILGTSILGVPCVPGMRPGDIVRITVEVIKKAK